MQPLVKLLPAAERIRGQLPGQSAESVAINGINALAAAINVEQRTQLRHIEIFSGRREDGRAGRDMLEDVDDTLGRQRNQRPQMARVAKRIIAAGRTHAIDLGRAQQRLEHAGIGDELAHFEAYKRTICDAAGLRNQMGSADDQFQSRNKLQHARITRP